MEGFAIEGEPKMPCRWDARTRSDSCADPKVAVTADLPGKALEMLAGVASVRIHTGERLLAEDRLARFVGDADGLLTVLENPVGERLLGACPRLRVVANCAVGFDNVDLDAARDRGIWVTNTPDVLTEATADLTWALILAVTRRVVEGDQLLRSGRYSGWSLDLLLGSGLQGRRLGVVGYGRIGRAVARRAIAFGMEVAASDVSPPARPDPPALFLPLDELPATSHVVSLHCPLGGDAHHLLDEGRLRLMRPGGYLINTARGPLIDEEGLVRVLEQGHLGGAGLDVYEREPEVAPGLLGRRDVVLLPHIGSATRETRAAMAELAAANVVAVLEGRRPPTPVVEP